MDAEFTKKLLATFCDEAEEHLSGMVDILLVLEKSGAGADPALVERIYRTTHSLKGASRAVSQKEIESICQNLENVFSRMKNGTYIPDADAYDIFHKAVKVIHAILNGERPDVSPSDIVAGIRIIAKKDMGVSYGTTDSSLPVQSFSSNPLPPFAVKDPESGGVRVGAFAARTSNSPSEPPVVQAAGIVGMPVHDGGTVRIASHKLDRLIAGSDDLLTTRLFITHRLRELEEMMTRFTLWRWNQAQISSDVHSIREKAFGSAKTDLPEDVVLPLQRLVEFFDYDREFGNFLRHDLAEHIRSTERDRSALEASTSEISDLIHDAVLQPVSSILAPFPGLVREYSRNTGKQVELIMEGDEIEVDRRILDALKDPLMHLIYNSIDHGVEYPDIRVSRNKIPCGHVKIKVFTLSGGKVGIEVSDDGNGIDGRIIRQAAVRAGVITAREESLLTDAEAIWLIFRSGLSTSPIITEISGRGLGLAIVEDSVTRLGGYVTISSDVGKGTSITMRVPARLVTFRGVVVRSGSQVYVLPMQQVRQVLRMRRDAIVYTDGRPSIRFDNEMIGVLQLSDLLGIPHPRSILETEKQISLVIIAYGAGQVACRVDEVIRVQEIVVRPLGGQLRRVKRIAGAAVLGDGTLALVLDPPELIQESLRPCGPSIPITYAEKAACRILVVEDSVTSRAFLQILLERDGYQVSTAIDGLQAFAMLKENEPDMVVSDVDMPRMNGFVLTEKIRADNRLSHLPVVLVTSLDSAEDQRHGIAVGADAYIVKSTFEKNHLLAVIRDLIRMRHRPGPGNPGDT
ncbi:response regulator [Methanoregula sp.]|uniref:hybrid sensor histidine kinase/response regulator n=1 Tax=Methanoregula sp. TaxID=2052170 RepID=UPI0023731239|nr:response regulator [Methanoregula sp.]MDD1687567.1 response regulator [Methanoregula sp.]